MEPGENHANLQFFAEKTRKPLVLYVFDRCFTFFAFRATWKSLPAAPATSVKDQVPSAQEHRISVPTRWALGTHFQRRLICAVEVRWSVWSGLGGVAEHIVPGLIQPQAGAAWKSFQDARNAKNAKNVKT